MDEAVAAEDSATWAIATGNRTTTTISTILSKILETTTKMDHKIQTPTPPPIATTTTALATMATIFNSPRPRGDGAEDAEAGSRRSTTTLPGGLATSNRRKLGSPNYRAWIQNPIRHSTSMQSPSQQTSNTISKGDGNDREGDPRPIRKTRHRRGYRTWIHQPALYSTKANWRPSTMSQPPPSQPVCTTPTLQDGDDESRLQPHQQGRLHDEHRSTGRFLHVLIHSSSRKYLQFHWKGKQYQFRVLPFGLSLAPFVFTKILKPVLRWARRRGIRISAYLDDLLIMAKSFQQAEEATQAVLDKLSSLGFLIKPSKSQLTPTQTITHLGFTIDTKSMTLSVPKDKVRDIRREATKILRKGALTVRALSSFIGKALAMTAAVLPARLRTQHLVQLKNEALRQHNSWTASVSLTDQAKEDLTWWIDGLKSWNGQSWIQQPPEEEVFTDASDAGWGIVSDRYAKSGTWTGPLLSKHINYKELLVVWKVVTHPRFQGKRLLIYCDNTTTLAYVNKFGGTRSPELMELANQIWTHCLATGTTLTTAYIPIRTESSRPPESTASRAIGMEYQPRDIQHDRQQLGSTQHRPIRLQHKHQTTTIHG